MLGYFSHLDVVKFTRIPIPPCEPGSSVNNLLSIHLRVCVGIGTYISSKCVVSELDEKPGEGEAVEVF